LMIQKGLTESLAGRFEVTYVGHWSFSEMEEAFGWNVNQYIYYGAYPGAASLIHEEERWKNYIKDSIIEMSISKDILMLTRVDKPAVLKRFFELGCLYSGQILAYTKLLGELQDAGNTTTLSHYLTLLSDSGLLGTTEKYAGNVIRKRASKPKFQVFNNALLTAQDDLTYEKVLSDSKIWGRLVESAIGAHLINNAITNNYTVYYWREKNDEVDFILERKNTLIALEVKTGRRAENNGMRIFAETFKPKKVLLIGTGGIGIETFLRMNPGDLFN
jgi:predicted AAA+ superfamily ATPase